MAQSGQMQLDMWPGVNLKSSRVSLRPNLDLEMQLYNKINKKYRLILNELCHVNPCVTSLIVAARQLQSPLTAGRSGSGNTSSAVNLAVSESKRPSRCSHGKAHSSAVNVTIVTHLFDRSTVPVRSLARSLIDPLGRALHFPTSNVSSILPLTHVFEETSPF